MIMQRDYIGTENIMLPVILVSGESLFVQVSNSEIYRKTSVKMNSNDSENVVTDACVIMNPLILMLEICNSDVRSISYKYF